MLHGTAKLAAVLPPIDIIPTDLVRLMAELEITEVTMMVRGRADLAKAPVRAIHRLRGAMGHYLAIGASDAAVAGRLCTFSPPCGYAALHNDLPGPFREGKLPKPFVPLLDAVGPDLKVTFRLFGHAKYWAAEFRAAMVGAARMGLDRAQGGPLVLDVIGTETISVAVPTIPDDWKSVTITTLTPVVQRSDGAKSLQHGPVKGLDFRSLLSGIRFRAGGMAHWQGLSLELDLQALRDEATRAAKDALVLAEDRLVKVGRGAEGKRDRQGWIGSVALSSLENPVRTLLWLATLIHVGADTSVGAGRIKLQIRSG